MPIGPVGAVGAACGVLDPCGVLYALRVEGGGGAFSLKELDHSRLVMSASGGRRGRDPAASSALELLDRWKACTGFERVGLGPLMVSHLGGRSESV